jgi:hypothetical protein
VQVSIWKKETSKLFQIRLECNRYNEKPENETELKQLENVLVAKLDVFKLDSIKKAF